jgi:hypothetical protein
MLDLPPDGKPREFMEQIRSLARLSQPACSAPGDWGLNGYGSVPPDEPRGLGPFRLAYLEALVRIADWRASDRPSEVVA